MHQVLRIPEIILHIFGYCSTESRWRRSADLAVLARTCRTFKEPALDALWEELYDLSPLARCLPEACYLAEPGEKSGYWRIWPRYAFSRPPKGTEWITLRSYTRRVRLIRISLAKVAEEPVRMALSLAPTDDPLFPRLRSLYWNSTTPSALLHIVAPSLKILHLHFDYRPLPNFKEPLSFSAFGDHCPHMENFEIKSCYHGPMNIAISDLVCRWPKLQRVACSRVALNMDAISHLSSVPSLESLEFMVEISLVQDISQLGSRLVFSTLTFLEISSEFLDTITLLLRHIRLPAIETLSVTIDLFISRQAIQPYWAVLREACPSNVTSLIIRSFFSDEELPCLTLDVLHPCTAFAELRGFEIDFVCSVSLTDADLLELASPRMESLLINPNQGWHIKVDSGGITLSGLVRLLQKCPSLGRVCLAIDTRTFCKIPEELDVLFPARRELKVDVLDSYILPELVLGLVSTFTALGLGPPMLTARDFCCPREYQLLWKNVLDALRGGGS